MKYYVMGKMQEEYPVLLLWETFQAIDIFNNDDYLIPVMVEYSSYRLARSSSKAQYYKTIGRILHTVEDKVLSYKVAFIIDTDRRLDKGDTVTFEDQDYTVLEYKYNKDQERNELYIDLVLGVFRDITRSKEFKWRFNRLVNKINEYNDKTIKENRKRLGIKEDSETISLDITPKEIKIKYVEIQKIGFMEKIFNKLKMIFK